MQNPCKTCLLHVLMCKHNSDQRGFGERCKVSCLTGASPVCCQQHVCVDPKNVYHQKMLWEHNEINML